MKLFLSIALYLGISYNLFAYSEMFVFNNNKDIEKHRIEFSYSFQSNTQNNNKKNTVIIDMQLKNNTSVSYDIQLQEGYHILYWYPHLIGDIVSATVHYEDTLSINTFNFLLETQLINIKTAAEYNIVSASLDDILNWKPIPSKTGEKQNDEMYLFRWQSYPDVLIFSFKNKSIQADYLKRIAFYTEKVKYRGKVEDSATIKNKHGWSAHNYRALDFANFYNAINKREQDEGIPPLLNEREIKLKNILLSLGVINQSGKYYITTNNNQNIPIISFMRTLKTSLKKTLVFHELLHSFFYRDKTLRNKVDALWEQFTTTDKLLWRGFLTYNTYDPDYDYLLKNELFAYLLQRPLRDLSWYRYARIIADALRRLGKNSVSKSDQTHFANILMSSAEQLIEYINRTYSLYDSDLRYVKKHK